MTISRTDGLRSASISGSITSDDTQAVGIEIQDKIDGLALPPGVEVTSGGVFAQIAEGFQDIFLAMAVGIVLIYLVMVASLGSLRNPFVIVTSLPLAIIGALAALAITGRSLGLPAMMGILMLIGIVVTNAIVLISFVEQLRQRGLSVYDALMRGGRIRLRPILMTAITTSIALLPLAAFVEGGGRHHRSAACHRGDRRPGQLDGANSRGGPGSVHAGQPEHPRPSPPCLYQTAARHRAPGRAWGLKTCTPGSNETLR